MQLIFPPDKSVELSFKVGIAGTNSVPSSVAIVLERNSTALSFKAVKSGDEWTAVINNPGSVFEAGQVNLSVNIVVNNRLFTPMKSTATIEAVAQTAPEEPVKGPPVQLNTDTQTNNIPAMEEVKEEIVVEEKIVEKVDQVNIIKDIFKSSPHKPARTEPILERVTVVPFKLQLLKSIEKGTTTVKPKPIVTEQEKVVTKKKPNALRIKKTRVVYL
jgi:hypothetical protein